MRAFIRQLCANFGIYTTYQITMLYPADNGFSIATSLCHVRPWLHADNLYGMVDHIRRTNELDDDVKLNIVSITRLGF